MFEEKQNLKIVWVVVIIILIIMAVLGFGAIGTENEKGEEFPVITVFFNIGLMVFLFLLSYNFQIKLTSKKLFVQFGVGILKKSFDVNEIDKSSIKIVRPSKWYGIGWRYNFDGDMIFNAKYGKAVKFQLKNQSKKYYVGAVDYKRLEQELLRLIPEN